MSRSIWAWTGSCALVGVAVRGAGGLVGRARFGLERVPGTARSFTCLSWLVVVLALGLAVVSASAASVPRREHRAADASRRSDARTRFAARGLGARRGSASGGLLAFGAGYFSPDGSGLVRALQRDLARAGDRPGPIDGRYGPLTERAVSRFQDAHGLQVDGIAGPRTLGRLHGGARRKAHPRPHPVRSRSAGTHRRTSPAAGHRRASKPALANTPAGSSSNAWLVLLTGLVLVLLASVLRHARRRAGAGRLAWAPSSDGSEAQYRQADRNSDPDGAFNLGVPLEHKGELTGAKAAYQRALRRGQPAAACNLGVLLESEGDLAGAEAAYRQADRNGDPSGAFNLGVLLEHKGELTGAEAAFRRAHEHGSPEVAQLAHAALLDLDQASATRGAQTSGARHDDR